MIANSSHKPPKMTIPKSYSNIFGSLAAIILLIFTMISLPVILYYVVIIPSRQISVEIDTNAQKLLRARTVIANANGENAATNHQSLVNLASDFVTGSDATLAFADLQSNIGKLIIKNGSTLVQARQVEINLEEDSINAAPSTIATLGISITFRGSIINVYKIVHNIEANKPLLFITSAKLRIFGDPANRLLSSGKIPAQLVAELEIVAYSRPKDLVPNG